MWQLEIKIISLTLIYFAGWFIFEKVILALYNLFFGDKGNKSAARKRRIVQLASVTPADQTWRYIKGTLSQDWRIRRISCVQLGERRGTAVVSALIDCLNDSREEVSLAAGESLAKIGDPMAIDALAEHCEGLKQKSIRSYENYKAA